uniref:FERM_C domain-containing protein n=1 Tax=Macrostomum lignano TaxID=282301 RepID=A0A1I8IUI4_9PLAT
LRGAPTEAATCAYLDLASARLPDYGCNTARLFFAAGHSDSAIGGSLASGHQTLCLSDRGIGVHADGAATGSCQLRYPWHAVENLYCKDRRFVVDLVPPNEQSLLEDADKQLMAALADPTTVLSAVSRKASTSLPATAGAATLSWRADSTAAARGIFEFAVSQHRFTLDFAASAAAAAAASSGGPAAHLSGLSGGGDSGCCSCRSSGSSLLRRPSLDRISTSSADATPVRVSKRQQPQQQRGSPAGGSDSVDRCGCHSRSPSPPRLRLRAPRTLPPATTKPAKLPASPPSHTRPSTGWLWPPLPLPPPPSPPPSTPVRLEAAGSNPLRFVCLP